MAQTEREVLVALFNATDGLNWKNSGNWNTDADLSQWHGMKTNDQGRVVEINLYNNNLQGPIPPELGNLSALQILNLGDPMLGGNKLTGGIPASLGKLSNLQVLLLHNNELRGPIPHELGALTKLEGLRLGDNALTGRIPEELGKLTALQRLVLYGNQLSGAIPPELGKLGALQELSLRRNKLSGFWQPLEQNQTGAMQARPGTLPHGLENLLQICERVNNFGLDGNPWQHPPESIVMGGMPAVREYFEALYRDGTTTVTRPLKVVIVGKQTVGKTSLRRSIKAGKPCMTQTGGSESTVHVDVEDHVLDDNHNIRIFDCAGQVVYYGLLQLFLTPRAVYLLVWDAEEASQKVWAAQQASEASEVNGSHLEDLAIAPWLRNFTFRVPDANVVLVGNKWDGVAEAKEDSLESQVEDESRQWLKAWRENAKRDQPHGLALEHGVCRVSCAPSRFSVVLRSGRKTGWPCDRNRPGLLQRIIQHPAGGTRAVTMSLPLSYQLALDFLVKESRHRRAAGHESPGMTREALEKKWLAEVELRIAGQAVAEQLSALSGAILIRKWEGGLVEYGSYVFLDVQWFAEVLDPLFSHKRNLYGSIDLGGRSVTKNVRSLRRLDNDHIFEPRLAEELWGPDLARHLLAALKSAGLTFPMPNDPNEGLVILVLMKDKPPPGYDTKLKQAIAARKYDLKLIFHCKFSLGLPPGLIERILARCCQLGHPYPFWRYGALISGEGGQGSFSADLRYSDENKLLEIVVHGGREKVDAWATLSKVLSVLIKMLSEYGSLPCEPQLFCPLHEEKSMPITRNTKPGSRLVEESDFCPLCLDRRAGISFLAAALQVVEFSDTCFLDEQLSKEFAENATKVAHKICEPWLSSNYQNSDTRYVWYEDVKAWILLASGACLTVFTAFVAKDDDDPRLWGSFLAVGKLLILVDAVLIGVLIAKKMKKKRADDGGGGANV